NITALGFRLSKKYIKDFFIPIYASNDKNFRFSLYVLNNMPVAACLVFLSPPHSSIFSLATLPKFRNKGIAFSLLQHELSFAKNENVSKCAVQATPLGKNVYKMLGFEEILELSTYIFLP